MTTMKTKCYRNTGITAEAALYNRQGKKNHWEQQIIQHNTREGNTEQKNKQKKALLHVGIQISNWKNSAIHLYHVSARVKSTN